MKIRGTFKLSILLLVVLNFRVSGEDATFMPPTCTNDADDCGAGNCEVVGSTSLCNCGVFFFGSHCDYINIHVPEYNVDADSITFTWHRPPKISDEYVSLSYIEGEEYNGLVKSAEMNDTERTLVIGDLKPDRTANIVCLLQNKTLEASSENGRIGLGPFHPSTKSSSGFCARVITGYDGYGPYAKAAIGIGISIAVICFLLMVLSVLQGMAERESREKGVLKVMGKLHLLNRASTLFRKSKHREVSSDQQINNISQEVA